MRTCGNAVYLAPVSSTIGPTALARQLHQRALLWARALMRRGVQPGATVVTMLHNTVENYVVWFGIAWAGAIEVPINVDLRGSVLSHQLNLPAAEIVIADSSAIANIAAVAENVPSLHRLAGYTPAQRRNRLQHARNLAVELGWDSVPGTTVTRYCSSSLQSTRMAMHAIRAGEGDVFLSVGVEGVSQHALAFPAPLPDARHPMFVALDARTADSAAGGQTWNDPRTSGGWPPTARGGTWPPVGSRCTRPGG